MTQTSNSLVRENERFYFRRITDWCELGRFESALESLGNMERFEMVSRMFVDTMLDSIAKIAESVGYRFR